MRKIIAVVSGGLDSTTMVYDALDMGYEVDCISFDYGQRHSKELRFAKRTAAKLSLRHDIVDLSHLGVLFRESGSSLVSEVDVPEGHYAEDNMKATVVPNRNMIMLSIAGGIAIARKANCIMTAVHAGDHFIYPDCRPEFLARVSEALVAGNEGFANWATFLGQPLSLIAPYAMKTKAEIAARAIELGVPLEETWSCYKGGEKHCGKCGTCVERLEAIDEAIEATVDLEYKYVDKTEYEDTMYWQEVITKKMQEN